MGGCALRVKMRKLFFSTAISAALGAMPAAQAAPPQKVEVAYELGRNGMTLADVTHRLEHDGKSYRLTENVRGKGVLALKGDITRTSSGVVAADGLRPKHFEDKRSGRDTVQAAFDPAAKTPTLQQQDQLSVVWTFAFAPPGKEVAVSVADGKRVSHYAYQPAGREKVKTPAGEFDALKFVKKRERPEDKSTEVWIAVDRQIPVRILIVDKDGTRMDQLAAKISPQ
jgi:hypothetical protein